MNIIYEFCKDAERVYVSTKQIETLRDLIVKIDPTKDDVFRTRDSKNDTSCIFNFILNIGESTTLKSQVDYMRTIEMFYPELFSWRFNGKHIEAIAEIPIKKDYQGIISRYGGFDSFIKRIRERLNEILKFRDFQNLNQSKIVSKKIYSTGSLNTDTQMYVVDIQPNFTHYKIIENSTSRVIKDIRLKPLNLKFWVKEVNPDFFKEMPTNSKDKYSLTNDIFDKYPLCIKKLMGLPKKGNYNRFLIATYLLGVHNKRDAKHQLDICLSKEELEHINTGNCKDQWRTIVAKKYSPPSCKTMIETGFAKNLDDCRGIGMYNTEEKNDNKTNITK